MPISCRNYVDTPASRPTTRTAPKTATPSNKAATATNVNTRSKNSVAKVKAKPETRSETKSKTGTKKKPIPKTKNSRLMEEQKAKRKEKFAAKKARQKEKMAKRKEKKAKRKEENAAKKAGQKAKKKKISSAEKARQVQGLKATALDPPRVNGETVWLIICRETAKDPDFTPKAKGDLGNVTREASRRYQSLTPERREHFNRIVIEKNASIKAVYRQWLESHTPEQIRLANLARRNLSRRGMKKYVKLIDNRQVKGVRSARMCFFSERHATSRAELAGIKFGERSQLFNKEWIALPLGDKKKYEDMALQDRQRWVQEMKAVYNKDVAFLPSPQSPQPSKAAPVAAIATGAVAQGEGSRSAHA